MSAPHEIREQTDYPLPGSDVAPPSRRELQHEVCTGLESGLSFRGREAIGVSGTLHLDRCAPACC